jgi:hypothetical protein
MPPSSEINASRYFIAFLLAFERRTSPHSP